MAPMTTSFNPLTISHPPTAIPERKPHWKARKSEGNPPRTWRVSRSAASSTMAGTVRDRIEKIIADSLSRRLRTNSPGRTLAISAKASPFCPNWMRRDSARPGEARTRTAPAWKVPPFDSCRKYFSSA